MIIGVPKEIKLNEYRVAITPSGVDELTIDGHIVYVESDAGVGSGFTNSQYKKSGAKILKKAKSIWDKSELIVKVKEPIASEYKLLKPKQIIFTYLHLAADKKLTKVLLKKQISSFAYETLEIDKHLPLLEPMSEVAGKMAALMGAVHLSSYNGAKGLFIGGVIGTSRANVMILGGGVAGKAAAQIASGLGANVTILDINMKRLSYLDDVLPSNVSTLYSSNESISKLLPSCDIVIGTVLIAGAKTPKLITKEMLKDMKKGSVLVDVSIDQGGCFESSHPTTHSEPTFIKKGIIHYCVSNMPGAYPVTSTYALTNVTLPYIRKLANHGIKIKDILPAMNSALNTLDGRIINKAVAKAHNTTKW